MNNSTLGSINAQFFLQQDPNNKVYCKCNGGNQLMGSVNSQDGMFDTYHSQGTIARFGNMSKCRACGGVFINK
jgi:hypothetical protein